MIQFNTIQFNSNGNECNHALAIQHNNFVFKPVVKLTAAISLMFSHTEADLSDYDVKDWESRDRRLSNQRRGLIHRKPAL